MRSAGIDVGSRTIKFVVMEQGKIVHRTVTDTTSNPLAVCEHLLSQICFDILAVTGYGRHLLHAHRPDAIVITEIKAAAFGARFFDATCRSIVDIGGQDTKLIALDAEGRVVKFAMNDRCAAGTGRFLEMTAAALAFTMNDFEYAASRSERAVKLSGMCSVFAESEVITLVAKGTAKEDIALGVYQSVAARTAALAGHVPINEPILFTGGTARSAVMLRLIGEHLKKNVTAPKDPQAATALGCAIFGARNTGQHSVAL